MAIYSFALNVMNLLGLYGPLLGPLQVMEKKMLEILSCDDTKKLRVSGPPDEVDTGWVKFVRVSLPSFVECLFRRDISAADAARVQLFIHSVLDLIVR